LNFKGISNIIKAVNDKETAKANKTRVRYAVTQQQIDDVLENELKGFVFPVKPVYNSRIRANGRTIGELYPWGQLKDIKAIEIGKQDLPNRNFLIDTLLHEYYEAYIMQKQFTDGFFKNLSKAGDQKRHKWINSKISDFFNGIGGMK
jgi:hypothetical protein